MDAAYLKSTVGDVLSHALAFVASQQPDDAIECLAHYLKKHAANVSAKHSVRSLMQCLASGVDSSTSVEMMMQASYGFERISQPKADSQIVFFI